MENCSLNKWCCSFCEKSYSDKKGLSRHMAQCHPNEGNEDESGSLKCPLCDIKFRRITPLALHVKDIHNITLESSEHSFSSYGNFISWKKAEEKNTSFEYVKHSGSVTKNGIIYSYFYCNRSGVFASKGKGKRNVKVQKSSKIGGTCIARMAVEESVDNGSCNVHYFSSHCGHNVELAHIRLPESSKLQIMAQLKAGVSIDSIMDSIRDVSLMEGIKREHLTVKQDVRNISHKLNLANIEKHSNDQTSVFLWVQEAKLQPYNPVLVFKQQGKESADIGQVDDLSKENFLLGLQTEFQRDMMKKFGNNAICMDATHGTNSYDFLLITVMVLDDFGEGIPVGWAISDKEDVFAITQFLKAIRESVGPLNSQVFMSDDAEQYYTAWCGVFGPVSMKLLCSWHIDRAWKKAISEHVKGTEQKLEVYHMLRALLNERNIIDFQILFTKAMTFFEEEQPRFHQYMKSWYAQRVEQWASCYRSKSQIGTNMHLEAFHRVLKIDYMKHKQNRRIDHLLHILFKCNRDLVFKFLRKNVVGHMSHRVCIIRKHHTSALDLISKETVEIETIDDITWKVKSASQLEKWYIVEKNTVSDCNCHLRCDPCNICVHSFSCTCLSSLLHHTVCKHVHLICLICHVTLPAQLPKATYKENRVHTDISTTITSAGPGLSVPACSKVTKETVIKKIDELKGLVSDSTLTNLSSVNSHISSAIAYLKSEEIQVIVPKKRPAPNSNTDVQERFYSTRKKTKISGTSNQLKKPSSEEYSSICDTLNHIDPEVCGICFDVDDKQYDEIVKWIECINCLRWFHYSCVKRSLLQPTVEEENFKCSCCREREKI